VLRYQSWYRFGMAMNLRLTPEAEEALRAEAKRTGRSQQDLLREALDRYLHIQAAFRRTSAAAEALISAHMVTQPRHLYRKVTPRLRPPAGASSLDLLDRDDRI
jgi:predicted DNA-binding protein